MGQTATVIDIGVKMKVCARCKTNKPHSEYHKNKDRTLGVQPRCKVCRNEVGRDTYKSNPKVRRSGLKNRPDKVKKKYGVTYEHIVRMLEMQFGRCANVGCSKDISLDVPLGPDRAVVDHCHKTGKFRALLCIECNMLLGGLETKAHKLQGLLQYINKHR